MVLPLVKCWMCVIRNSKPLTWDTWSIQPLVETQYPDYSICNECPEEVLAYYKRMVKVGRRDKKWLAKAVKGDKEAIPADSYFKLIQQFKEVPEDYSCGFDLKIFEALARYGLTPYMLNEYPISLLQMVALDHVKQGIINEGHDDIFIGNLRPDGLTSLLTYDLENPAAPGFRWRFTDLLEGVKTGYEPFFSTRQVFTLTRCALRCAQYKK